MGNLTLLCCWLVNAPAVVCQARLQATNLLALFSCQVHLEQCLMLKAFGGDLRLLEDSGWMRWALS